MEKQNSKVSEIRTCTCFSVIIVVCSNKFDERWGLKKKSGHLKLFEFPKLFVLLLHSPPPSYYLLSQNLFYSMIFDYIFMRNCIDLTHCCVSPPRLHTPTRPPKKDSRHLRNQIVAVTFWHLPPHDKTKPLCVTEKRKKEEKTT